MELRQLEYVVGVVDAGSFTKAAVSLHVAQPSLSQGIARLEAELGIRLFDRLGRRVALTDAGRAFVEPARQVLRDVAVADAVVGEVGGVRAGVLDVVALPTLVVDPLAPALGRFRRAHPDIAVRVREPETADAVAASVRDGRAEVGLAELPVTDPALSARSLGDQELVVVLPPGEERSITTVHDLADVPLVAGPPGTSTRRILERAFATAGISPRVAVETEQREGIVPLVLAGAGVALLPVGPAAVAAGQGARIARLAPPLRRTIGIIVRVAPLSPAAQRFVDLALDAASEAA